MSLKNCQTMRRKLVRRGILSLKFGVEIRSAEWVTEECGVPLFSNDGPVCRGCAGGWWHPENFPLTMLSELEQPCPALAMPEPATVEREYDLLYLQHYERELRTGNPSHERRVA